MPRTPRRLYALLPLVALLVFLTLTIFAPDAAAITLGQVDDFQDGTAADWIGANPINEENAGPDGTGDNALSAESFGGIGPGSRLTINNTLQWVGDWTAAGVTQITFDILNPGEENLTIRLGLAGPESVSGGGFGDAYATTTGQVLPADDQWHSMVFEVTADAWTYVGVFGGSGIETALTDVTQFRVLHNPALSFNGDAVAGSFLIDNITAAGDTAELIGDFNKDGFVDAADYVMWRKDPSVGSYDDWVEHFGESLPPGAGGTAAPEPTASALAALALVLLSLLRGTANSPRLSRG
jgi:hypothetical protein